MKLILCFLFSAIEGGTQTLDSAYIKCVYNLKFLQDSTKKNIVKDDILYLFIGKKVSTFYSYSKFLQDSMFNASLEKGNIEEVLKNPALRNKFASPGFYLRYQLDINYPELRITTTDQIGLNKFIYTEEIEKINWTILLDTLTIQNYICQKATASFRGRQYIAWFTQEIPISAGPYKFQGLPGLIMKVNDTQNNYIFECIGIENLIAKHPIILNDKGFIRTTRSDFRKAFKAMFQNPLEAITMGNNVSIGGPDADKLKTALLKGLPYNPIELE